MILRSIFSIVIAIFFIACGGSSEKITYAKASVENGSKAYSQLSILNNSSNSIYSLYANNDKLETLSEATQFLTQLAVEKIDESKYLLREFSKQNSVCLNGGNSDISTTKTDTQILINFVYKNCQNEKGSFDGEFEIGLVGENLLSLNMLISAIEIKFNKDTKLTTQNYENITFYKNSIVVMSEITGLLLSAIIDNDISYKMLYSLHFTKDEISYKGESIATLFEKNTESISVCYKDGRVYIDNMSAYLDIDTEFDPNCEQKLTYQGVYPNGIGSGKVQLIANDLIKILIVVENSEVNISTQGLSQGFDILSFE